MEYICQESQVVFLRAERGTKTQTRPDDASVVHAAAAQVHRVYGARRVGHGSRLPHRASDTLTNALFEEYLRPKEQRVTARQALNQ